MARCFSDPVIVDAYLIYKFAQFNKPYQTTVVAEYPADELPYIDLDKVDKYNKSLFDFSKLPLTDRVNIITKGSQQYNFENTIFYHFVILEDDIRTTRFDMGLRNDNPIIRAEDILEYYTELTDIEKIKVFHFFDIYHSNSSDAFAYPYLINSNTFYEKHECFHTEFIKLFNKHVYGTNENTNENTKEGHKKHILEAISSMSREMELFFEHYKIGINMGMEIGNNDDFDAYISE
jgi:hypothetical protein